MFVFFSFLIVCVTWETQILTDVELDETMGAKAEPVREEKSRSQHKASQPADSAGDLSEHPLLLFP